MGFLMSDIMGIQGAIVNGVEISITMIPNTDNIRLQSFKNNTYGRIVIDDIYMYVCKRQFSKCRQVMAVSIRKRSVCAGAAQMF